MDTLGGGAESKPIEFEVYYTVYIYTVKLTERSYSFGFDSWAWIVFF